MTNELEGPIDYKLLGMKRITSRVLKDPALTNTKVIGIALSQSLLDQINHLARTRYPDVKYPRSRFMREMIERGIEQGQEEGGAS